MQTNSKNGGMKAEKLFNCFVGKLIMSLKLSSIYRDQNCVMILYNTKDTILYDTLDTTMV